MLQNISLCFAVGFIASLLIRSIYQLFQVRIKAKSLKLYPELATKYKTYTVVEGMFTTFCNHTVVLFSDEYRCYLAVNLLTANATYNRDYVEIGHLFVHPLELVPKNEKLANIIRNHFITTGELILINERRKVMVHRRDGWYSDEDVEKKLRREMGKEWK